jgi:hypothetical protein
MDEVAIVCSPTHNNSDAHSRVIYVSDVADPGVDVTHAYTS